MTNERRVELLEDIKEELKMSINNEDSGYKDYIEVLNECIKHYSDK